MAEQKDEMSKELADIAKAIKAYADKHEGNVIVTASFAAFEDKDCTIVDDRLFAFGGKEELIIDLKEMLKAVKKEKEDFIYW